MIKKALIESKVHEIADLLLTDILNEQLNQALQNDLSLMTGKLGVVIFLNRYINDY